MRAVLVLSVRCQDVIRISAITVSRRGTRTRRVTRRVLRGQLTSDHPPSATVTNPDHRVSTSGCLVRGLKVKILYVNIMGDVEEMVMLKDI